MLDASTRLWPTVDFAGIRIRDFQPIVKG